MGQPINFADPSWTQVLDEDLLTGMAHITRYGGQWPCTLLAHSVLVGGLAKERGMAPDMVRLAYAHDAHEVFVGDVHPALKDLLGTYREIEDRWEAHVRAALRVPIKPDNYGEIRGIDALARKLEMFLLCHPGAAGYGPEFGGGDLILAAQVLAKTEAGLRTAWLNGVRLT